MRVSQHAVIGSLQKHSTPICRYWNSRSDYFIATLRHCSMGFFPIVRHLTSIGCFGTRKRGGKFIFFTQACQFLAWKRSHIKGIVMGCLVIRDQKTELLSLSNSNLSTIKRLRKELRSRTKKRKKSYKNGLSPQFASINPYKKKNLHNTFSTPSTWSRKRKKLISKQTAALPALSLSTCSRFCLLSRLCLPFYEPAYFA